MIEVTISLPGRRPTVEEVRQQVADRAEVVKYFAQEVERLETSLAWKRADLQQAQQAHAEAVAKLESLSSQGGVA